MSDLLDEADEAIETFDELVRQRDALRAEVERLRINLRDYRQKHPCHHEIMCWSEEVTAKALARGKCR